MATYKELLEQQQQLNAQIEEARKREINDAVTQVRNIVHEFQLTPQDIFPTGRRSAGNGSGSRAGTRVPPKYRDPATGQTWTGRGKPPRWIAGQDRERFLIRD